jgi:hypothetical protein
MGTLLVPCLQIRLRAVILAVLIGLALIGGNVWLSKITFCLVAFTVVGTFPETEIDEKYLTTQWFVGFVRIRPHQVRLDDVVTIETGLDELWEDAGSLFIAWPMRIVWFASGGWLWDRLFPWLGGRYTLKLRTLFGDHIHVWQGSNEGYFYQNLQVLEDLFDLPVERG